MLTRPIALRRTEALCVFILGLIAYHHSGYSWLSFALLFFLPDAGAIGYFKSKMIALIWITHVMFDRMLGWGFKTGGSFYHTGMGDKRDPRAGKT